MDTTNALHWKISVYFSRSNSINLFSRRKKNHIEIKKTFFSVQFTSVLKGIFAYARNEKAPKIRCITNNGKRKNGYEWMGKWWLTFFELYTVYIKKIRTILFPYLLVNLFKLRYISSVQSYDISMVFTRSLFHTWVENLLKGLE